MSPDWVIAEMARRLQVSAHRLRGREQTRAISTARGIVAYLARVLTRESYAQIGKALGGRDHSTVIHLVNTTLEDLEHPELAAEMSLLEAQLREAYDRANPRPAVQA